MLWRKRANNSAHRTQFEINSNQCSCCLAIPYRLRPVTVGQAIAFVCDDCYTRYNSDGVPLKDGIK